MNKNIKKVVYKILQEDKLAREDDWYLIFQTVCELVPARAGTAFVNVVSEMKNKGISFESITRARRKFFEKHPELKNKKAEAVRQKEEQEYALEYLSE